MSEQENLIASIQLDCENQHTKYYLEGYRESLLTQMHREDEIWDVHQIDVHRYAPNGARRNSYDQGWRDAINDLTIGRE